MAEVDLRCAKCNLGHFRPTGTCFTTDPPIFPHKCNNPTCDAMMNVYGFTYPKIQQG